MKNKDKNMRIKNLLIEREIQGGIQRIYGFDNNYGASVVKHRRSYGYADDKWELAVIKFSANKECWTITYDTPITSDVIGYLSEKEVNKLLKQIQEL